MIRNRSTSRFWAITAYFNPLGYQRRRDNYRVFRRNLNVPLLTVELVNGQSGSLGPDDADVLVRLTEGDILWQKERLLNVALAHLPPECDFVAWLDCDVVFERPDWPDATVDALERLAMIQPWQTVHDQRRDCTGPPFSSDASDANVHRQSFARMWMRGGLSDRVFLERGWSMKLGYSPGHAWAARRELLERHGFYDAFILGAGDKLMASAALGRQRDSAGAFGMTARQHHHYLGWADPWFASVRGRLGYLRGHLRHLWHGSLQRRQYHDRYEAFPGFRFDPYEDLALAADGSWRWSSHKPDLHRHVAEYFTARREDG